MKSEKRLDYFSHSVAGLAFGEMISALYLLVVRAQPTTRDWDGFFLVWGTKVAEVARWGLAIPLGFVAASLLMAKFFSAQQIYPRLAFLRVLAGLTLFFLAMIILIRGSMPIRSFPTPRENSMRQIRP